jgi:anti-anti-sigma regulatory factor
VVASAPSNLRPAPRPTGRLGSEEYHSVPLPPAQEAAVLYAGNHAAAAIALLKGEITEPAGRNNRQAWLVLFDLYQIGPNRPEFDALSALFAARFEQSPPAWNDGVDATGDPRRPQSRERKDFFALKPAADGTLAGEIDKLAAFAEAHGTVRLDVSKVAAITAGEATLLASALATLRGRQVPMWFNHLASLEKVLRSAFNERATVDQRPFWLLLFELYVLQGKDIEFEELGLEYAVAFESSPPGWQVYVNSVSAAAARATPATAAPAPEAGFELKGVLTATTSANLIAELNNHAAPRTEVTVDMGRVMRIDFAFTGAFFDVVKAIHLAGKRVILANLSELNAALLEAVGVNRYAILVRRRPA